MKLNTVLMTVGLMLLVVFPGAALAAAPDVHVTPVDLRPLLQEILLAVGSIASLVALWAIRMVGGYIRSKTGVNVLEQEALLRKYMESALQSGLKFASTKVDQADWAKVDTKNVVLNSAADYVVNAVPDALAYFKLDRDALLDRLRARFPDLEASLAQAAVPAVAAASSPRRK